MDTRVWLEEQAKRIQRELAELALREKVLSLGESIRVDIVLVKGEVVSTHVKGSKRSRTYVEVGKILSTKDWERILSIDWSCERRRLLELFQLEGMQHPMTPAEIKQALGFADINASRFESINMVLGKAGLPYRIRTLGKGGYWSNSRYTVYPVR